MPTVKLNFSRGFTLLELAIVLFILGLLIGGLLIPLATQVEQRDRRSVQQTLEEIKEALLGYAVINGRLPCPTVEADPASANYGMPVAPGSTECGEEGILPWKVLGVPETDPWGTPRTASGDPWRGHWRYRVDSAFSNDSPTFQLDTDPIEGLRVLDGNGNWLTAATVPGPYTPVFIVYSTGPDQTRNGLNADANDTEFQGGSPIKDTFDDITVWMTRPILLSTMLAAKKLP